MLCNRGLWCAFFVILTVSAVSAAQLIKDDLVVVVPTSVPTEDVRPLVDHRRQRNVTRLIGALRRTSIPPNNSAGSTPPLETPENAELSASMARVKKKIKHKRMWDEPEAQASEVQNTTSKRPDRIKTRRRLIPPSSTSTARALRTAVVLQEDPYYDFGKKLKHHPSSSTAGLNVLQDMETRTSVKSPIIVATTEEDSSAGVAEVDQDKLAAATVAAVVVERNNTPRPTRTQLSRNHTSNGYRRLENPQSVECVYPRFTRRNKSRSQRDVKCLPPASSAAAATGAEPDARTTRILSTVVTSVSSVKGNQKKNDTREPAALYNSTAASTATTTNGEYPSSISTAGTVSSTTAVYPEPVSGYPKYLRNRYRNISLPEYLEITKVNQRRLNSTTAASTAVTAESAQPSTSNDVTLSTASLPSSSPVVVIDSTEPVDIFTTSDKPLTDAPYSPPTDIQDFIYLNNGTSETPADTTVNGAVEARQRRPPLVRNITRMSTEHDVGVVYPDGLATSTYLLTFLAIVPLVLVIVFAFKLAVQRKKKKVFDSSEYSSEYNRSPLDFNTITSSPITTKLPRVSQHIVWDANEKSLSTSVVPLPSNSRWEFPREKLRLQTILGQGNFGQVWKAEADDISGHEGLTRLVAVKMVKEDAASREREDLIRELSIMQHLGSHPNVVTLLGCCTEKEPYLLIMEYVMYGKLLAFLRDRRTRSHYFNFSDSTASLTSRDLTVFAYCVARGMDFLVSKKIVHRDLAARNILVDHNKLCKIADFGMSRNVRDTNQIYEQRHTKGALPIRWMAPESLHYSIFTYKTDVWSFGVLMWEIVTLGSTPYCTMGAREVMRRVREGYRLDKPAHCRSELFKVITKCWTADPSKRPTFAELKQELGALLENPEFEGSYVDLESLVDESDGNAKDRQ
ncbi:Protein kinase, ATP binding site,Tyrosine-protein kinase, active site,Protein kinase domain,Protein [Cinara cedri]|uniref:receptor protein-tyrosine kinase n=1 Tax=Cinara cedri TaxID=506608 RepID=A0A5E4M192_9HEMI|nr:Protein kinase, ATP binding site,Tyrosine-protein kinase, active site,Protein kinase domain,Protein [Cinara cedri]